MNKILFKQFCIILILTILSFLSCQQYTITSANDNERDFVKIKSVPTGRINLNNTTGSFDILFAWNLTFNATAHVSIYNQDRNCTGYILQIPVNSSSSNEYPVPFPINQWISSCRYSGSYKVSGYFVNNSTSQTYDFDNTAVILTDYATLDPTLLIQKARAMKTGNPRFFEPPHDFNGWSTTNLNNTGSVGWSWTQGLPSVSTYVSRLNDALTNNPSNWLGYNCPGTNENNGFPYTPPYGSHFNHYTALKCNVGFPCFAFVYEASRQAGINLTPVSEAGQFITIYGTIPLEERKVGDLVLYNFDRSNPNNQTASDFSDHVAIITELNSANWMNDKVISSFGAHEFFRYGVHEWRSWDFHTTTRGGSFSPTGYWTNEYDQWDVNNIKFVRILN